MRQKQRSQKKQKQKNFNPRIPLGMRLSVFSRDQQKYILFQSTHPIRDATMIFPSFTTSAFYFNPRIPLGMRRALPQHELNLLHVISIHASH